MPVAYNARHHRDTDRLKCGKVVRKVSLERERNNFAVSLSPLYLYIYCVEEAAFRVDPKIALSSVHCSRLLRPNVYSASRNGGSGGKGAYVVPITQSVYRQYDKH